MNLGHMDKVKDYYGRVLSNKNDLKSTACCSTDNVPSYIKPILTKIHPEVLEKFYGCGVPLPPQVGGCTIVDLGCGTGRDCFVLSKLVGDTGKVIGIDMTDQQLEVGRRHLKYHTEQFGLKKPNIEFRAGYIEDLAALDLADDSVDLIVSNCVINLSPDKERVFAEAFRILKPGGELYFSDVFADRRLPMWMREDSVLLGECLGGAMYTEDFRRLMVKLGCLDHRLVAATEIVGSSPDVTEKIGNTRFFSMTFRAFKLPLEDRCEDFGQIATYKGTMDQYAHAFRLDDHHHFETGRPMLVCSNTAAMLSKTRYGKHFDIIGDESVHFGLFDCAPSRSTSSGQPDINGACC